MTVTFFDAELDRLYRGPDVQRDLEKRAIRVSAAAKLNATGIQVEGADNPEGRGPRQRTTQLYTSIRYADGDDSQGVFVDVGTDVFYGVFLETGLRNGRTYPFISAALPAAKG